MSGQVSSELDLSLLWRTLVRGWVLIAAFSIAGAVIGVVLAFVLPKRYEATVLLAPNLENEARTLSISAALGQLGGLAGLAGNRGSESRINIEIIKADSFALDFLRKHALEKVLFPERWDAANQNWKRDAKVPTERELVERFARIRNISEDTLAGTVRVAIQTADPVLSTQLVAAYVDEANAKLRTAAITRADRNISYLNDQYKEAQIVDVRNTISELTLRELRQAMTARTDPEYAFRIVDSPVPLTPRDYTSPKRRLVVALGLIAGLLAGMTFVTLRPRRTSK